MSSTKPMVAYVIYSLLNSVNTHWMAFKKVNLSLFIFTKGPDYKTYNPSHKRRVLWSWGCWAEAQQCFVQKGKLHFTSMTSLMFLRRYLRYYCPWMNCWLEICSPRKCDFQWGLHTVRQSLSRQPGHVSLQEGSQTSDLSSTSWSSSQWHVGALKSSRAVRCKNTTKKVLY